MDKAKVLLALAVVWVLAIPGPVQGTQDGPAAGPAARGEFVQNPATFDAVLNPGTGTDSYVNSSFNISIPSNATISSASVDLEGRPVVIPTPSVVCDFTGGGDANYKAYEGTSTSSNPGNSKPSGFSGSEFTMYQYPQIAQEDGSYVTTYAYQDYAYHHFAFKVPFDITSNLSVEYVGRGGYPYSSYSGSFACFLWNNGSGGSGYWEEVGRDSGTTFKKVQKDFKGSNYIDQNHIIHVLAMCTGSTYYYYYYILSDYIKVSVDGSKLSYPKNPSMKLGNRGSPTWILSNEPVFNYVYTVEDVTLINDIQSLVKPQSSQYVEIKIKLASDTPGVIRITNFKVSYTSPPWCKPIPAYHMPEDTPTKSLIDLSFYWTDDATSAKKLVYNITWQQDTRKLIANISSDPDTWHLDFKIPSMGKNWFGTVGFRVGAADGDGLFRESPTFFVTIDQVNDPPVITPIARQVATEGVPFNLTVVVKDVDRDGDSKDPNFPKDPTEEIIYGDNSSLFNIDPLTGEIFFTPSQEQVGVYDIQITATDREGESDQKNFTLEVRDAEDPPILDPIPEQTGMQDTEFSYSATAYDPDVPYGDELAFSDDSPMFEINASTGLIDFTPTVDDIGIHTVTITVTDRAGQNASQEFMFSIYNSIGSTDRPPSIQPIANQTAREGELFELWANASDPDIAELGDAITFADNCPIFDINKRTGKVSFTPGARDAGTYKVKITVKDGDGLTATAEFWLTVIKTNHPPVVTSILPRDGANVVQDKRFALSAEATDADGDLLNYTWRDGDTVLGYGSSVSVVFRDKGTYIITLTVSDGKSQQTNETTLEVIENTGGGGGGGLPGFEAVVVAASVAAVAAVLAGRRRR